MMAESGGKLKLVGHFTGLMEDFGLSSLDPDENSWSLEGEGDALDRASKVCVKKSLDSK